MIFMKHQTLGNAHFTDEEQEQLESAGWVRWPRSKEAKAGIVKPPVETKEPEKRRPGRPRKQD